MLHLRTARAKAVAKSLKSYAYENTDLLFYPDKTYSHKSGRLIDRFVSSPNVTKLIKNVKAPTTYVHSYHFAVIAEIMLKRENICNNNSLSEKLLWDKASSKALQSYTRLNCLPEKVNVMC